MGVGGKKKKKCSRKVKSAEVHVDEIELDATVEEKRVVSTAGVERMFVHPARYRAHTCTVKTYSSPKVLRWVRNLLDPAEKDKFMSTAIGPLLHVPMQKWSSSLFHFLLASQISIDDEGDKGKREEMRVMVCGKELIFGKKEFALISGLSFRKSNQKFSRPDKKPFLKIKHFPDDKEPVTGKCLKLFLFGKDVDEEEEDDEEKSRKCHRSSKNKHEILCECHQSSNSNAECEDVKIPLESDDKVKLSLLYVVHRYVLGKGDDKVVDYWYLMDNLVDFNSYPWAEIAFNITIDKSNTALVHQIKAAKPVGREVTYKCQGMAHVLMVWGLEVLPGVLNEFGNKTVFANWRPHMHSITCKSVIHHEALLKVLKDSKDEVCNDIMWHREDAKRLVMLGLCEGPLVDDGEEDKLKNENKVENEDLFEKGEEENMLESENVIVDEQVPEKSIMDDEEEKDLLGNVNTVQEEVLFDKDEEKAHVAHPNSQPDVLCSRTSTSVIASFESFVKKAMSGHTEDVKRTIIGEMEVFKSAVKGQFEELSVQVSNIQKTMLSSVECLAAEIKSIKDKIGGTQTDNALSKTEMGTPSRGHNEEGDFDGAKVKKPDVTPGNGSNSTDASRHVAENICNEEGGFENAAMKKPDVTPGNVSNSIELIEVDVSRAVAESICNSPKGKKRKRQKSKPSTGPVAPIMLLSDDTKDQGRARRTKKPAHHLLSPYTATGLVAKTNYFEESILDQRITKQDIADVNKFINLGMKLHGDNYDDDGNSLLSCSEYKRLLLSTGWLSGRIIDTALVLLHKSYPSDKSTGTWSYFETHLAQYCADGDFDQVDRLRTGLAGRRGLPPSEHLPSWDEVDVVYGVVCIKEKHWVALSIQVQDKTIIIYDSLRPNRNHVSTNIHPEVKQLRIYLEKAYKRGRWSCMFDTETPRQNDACSCGVFSLKFIEHMVKKIPVSEVKSDLATRYRCELAVQLFKKKFV